MNNEQPVPYGTNVEPEPEYIFFIMKYPFGVDMCGRYFIQVNGNESAIRKFKKINKYHDCLKFYRERYRRSQIEQLKTFKHIFDKSYSDNVEIYMFSGKLIVPGKNRIYEKTELEEWWEDHLDYIKAPNWQNIIEEVTDLS